MFWKHIISSVVDTIIQITYFEKKVKQSKYKSVEYFNVKATFFSKIV